MAMKTIVFSFSLFSRNLVLLKNTTHILLKKYINLYGLMSYNIVMKVFTILGFKLNTHTPILQQRSFFACPDKILVVNQIN